MKDSIGILLAGGTGSRLYPLTSSINKHMLPVYSKPLVYYSLSTLMLAQNREIIIVVNPQDEKSFKNLFGDGSKFGFNLSYVLQNEPAGIADGLNKCKKLANGRNINLILGDNIFYGKGLQELLVSSKEYHPNCLFTQEVKNPKNFGVVVRDSQNKAVTIVEKPNHNVSNEAVLGLYFYDGNVFDYIESLSPSKRGELEITDLNNIYLKQKKINIINVGRGISWFDAGTIEDLYEASNFIQAIEKRQNNIIGSIEEVALNNGWINLNDLEKILDNFQHADYAIHLKKKFF